MPRLLTQEDVITSTKQVISEILSIDEISLTDTIQSLGMDEMHKIEALMDIESALRVTFNDMCLENIDHMTVVEFAKHISAYIL